MVKFKVTNQKLMKGKIIKGIFAFFFKFSLIIADKMIKSQGQCNKYIAESNEEYEILHDVTKTGKDRNWKERKMGNLRFAERLAKLDYKESVVERVRTCGDVLRFVKDPEEGLKLYQAFFCKNRLCPMCNWRRSMKYSWQITQIIDKALEQYPNGRFLFLTLTVKNVPGRDLSQAIIDLNKSFHRLFRRKKVTKNMLGFVRSLEVTYNDERDDYHPHIHVLIMVKSTYFKGSENYIEQPNWTDMWQQSAKIDYTPIVNIKPIKEKVARDDLKNDFSEDGILKAVLETAKYPVKPFEIEKDKNGKIIKRSEEKLTEITGDLMDGLYKKRQLGFGGIFKDIRKKLHLDDIENGDLVNTSDEKTETTTGEVIVAYWNYRRGNYFIKQ